MTDFILREAPTPTRLNPQVLPWDAVISSATTLHHVPWHSAREPLNMRPELPAGKGGIKRFHDCLFVADHKPLTLCVSQDHQMFLSSYEYKLEQLLIRLPRSGSWLTPLGHPLLESSPEHVRDLEVYSSRRLELSSYEGCVMWGYRVKIKTLRGCAILPTQHMVGNTSHDPSLGKNILDALSKP